MDPIIENFDAASFESQWESLSETQKADLTKGAANFKPSDAILPVIKGLASYHFNIRNNARKTLNEIQSTIASSLLGPKDNTTWLKGMQTSSMICYRLFSLLASMHTLNEQSFYFKTLLNIKGKGAFFAFKALYQQKIPLRPAEKIVMTLPEDVRIEFVDQFLQTKPSTRLNFGMVFKRILTSLTTRGTVVKYYAMLFDHQRWADPFLHNIDFALRDPAQIFLREVRSSSGRVRARGLKALAMMSSDIPTDRLLDILATETESNIRSIIYKIIEISAVGQHKKAFYPILEMLATIGEKEKTDAVKALIVSGKLPIYTIFEILRENHPNMLPPLLEDLSRLDRLSFLVIQDIALNKEQYTAINYEVNLACIFGLIKKRPERVVRILKKFDNESNDQVRIGVTQFIENTKTILEKEKSSISNKFDAIVDRVEHDNKKTIGLIQSLFSTTAKKKIHQLQANKETTAIDFKGETISNCDFSDISFRASAIYFNRSMIVNCDFSKASLSNVFFKNCIFYNVNMQKTQFDSVNFDAAVFINVDAQRAVFKGCSFQKAAMYNCNLARASLRDANLIAANISKCSFKHTDISGACLAHAHVSAVSFLNTIMDQADLEYIQARFCRFPNSFRNSPASWNVNYNARKFQLTSKQIPKLSPVCVEKINMLLFCEFINYGETKFSRQNQMSLLTAFDIFKPKQAHLFHIIPYLLHENVPFPGIDEDISKQTPFGVYDYIPDKETRHIVFEYSKSKNLVARRHAHPWIEGLFTIGSTGSLAQTTDSDIDYWVCINEQRFTENQIKLLQKKLSLLEQFAQKQFNTQVTFFLVDILKAKNNDFGASTLESSGSAQSRLLKEEFYRTMIHVAGKLPLWSVLPTAISLNYYNKINSRISDSRQNGRYVDLGDIHAISTSEYFGASIWQMFKWLKSPFKSVIKMALLEKFIYEYGKTPLLCNTYKNQWMNSGLNLNLARNDSYYILLNHLVRYYRSTDNHDSVSILLTCFFLKLGISKDAEIENTVFGLRKILLEKCLAQWEWKKDVVFEIGSFKTWQYAEITRLSTTIENFMVKKYKTVNKAFENLSHVDSQISPKDRTILGRKVFIEFSKQSDKVDKVLLISRSDRHFAGLHLNYVKKDAAIGTWELVNKNARAYHGKDEPLIQAKTIEEIGAWLVNNGLYNESAVVNLVPNPTYVTYDDIRKLFKTLNDFLGPILALAVDFERLLLKNSIEHLFVSINFYAPRQQHHVTEYTMIYLNSWGEMFCKSVYSEAGFANMETVKKDILKRLNIEILPEHTAFYFSKGVAR